MVLGGDGGLGGGAWTWEELRGVEGGYDKNTVYEILEELKYV